MSDAPSQPELVCSRCQHVERDNAHLQEALRTISAENNDLAEELAIQRRLVVDVGRKLRYAENKLAQALEIDPTSEVIKTILQTWRTETGHLRAKIDLSGDRAQLVRKQLRRYKPEALIEAIKGRALLPYTVNYAPAATGTRQQRYDDVEHCIGTDRRIEKNREVWLRATNAGLAESQAAIDTYFQIAAQESLAMGVFLGAVSRREYLELPADEKRSLRELFDAKDEGAAWPAFLGAPQPEPLAEVIPITREAA